MFQDLGFWGLGFRVRFVPVLKEFRVMLRTVLGFCLKGFCGVPLVCFKRFQGLGFRALIFGFRVSVTRFRLHGLGFRALGFTFRIQGLGFKARTYLRVALPWLLQRRAPHAILGGLGDRGSEFRV